MLEASLTIECSLPCHVFYTGDLGDGQTSGNVKLDLVEIPRLEYE